MNSRGQEFTAERRAISQESVDEGHHHHTTQYREQHLVSHQRRGSRHCHPIQQPCKRKKNELCQSQPEELADSQRYTSREAPKCISIARCPRDQRKLNGLLHITPHLSSIYMQSSIKNSILWKLNYVHNIYRIDCYIN